MSKTNETFLAVSKSLLGLGLKSIDILIISQIEEYERNKCKCYLTNEQFSEMFGESISTIKRTLDKLSELNIIQRKDSYITGNGRANKQRTISLNKYSKWKVQNKPTIDECTVQNEPTKEMEGSKNDNGRFINEEWKVHNEPIKEKEKNNKKDNNGANAPKVASLLTANALPDKWTPKDNESHNIFESKLHTDIRVIEIIKQEHENYPHESAEYISNMACFYESNKEVIREYAKTILGIE